MKTTAEIPGYDYGTQRAAHSPVTMEELAQLKATADFTEEDERYLRMAGDVLSDQAEAMVNAWRERIGAQDYLAKVFQGPDGKPDDQYKAAVKARFVRWVIDLCTRPFDQAWLDYQEEIALRHLPEKKNKTDHAQTPPVVPLRYLVAFIAPIVITTRDFLGKKGHSSAQIEKMHRAWAKAVLLTVALWARPYTREGLW
jgi:hypothetical protein